MHLGSQHGAQDPSKSFPELMTNLTKIDSQIDIGDDDKENGDDYEDGESIDDDDGDGSGGDDDVKRDYDDDAGGNDEDGDWDVTHAMQSALVRAIVAFAMLRGRLQCGYAHIFVKTHHWKLS